MDNLPCCEKCQFKQPPIQFNAQKFTYDCKHKMACCYAYESRQEGIDILVSNYSQNSKLYDAAAAEVERLKTELATNYVHKDIYKETLIRHAQENEELNDYRDTGLSPKEIVDLKSSIRFVWDKLKEVFNKVPFKEE